MNNFRSIILWKKINNMRLLTSVLQKCNVLSPNTRGQQWPRKWGRGLLPSKIALGPRHGTLRPSWYYTFLISMCFSSPSPNRSSDCGGRDVASFQRVIYDPYQKSRGPVLQNVSNRLHAPTWTGKQQPNFALWLNYMSGTVLHVCFGQNFCEMNSEARSACGS